MNGSGIEGTQHWDQSYHARAAQHVALAYCLIDA